jgi:beta-phosphoglucomutase-like phosphatase (HAD superfamily)
MKKTVIFDMDGTLVDSMNQWYETGLEILKKYEIEGYQEIMDNFYRVPASRVIYDLQDQNRLNGHSARTIMDDWHNRMIQLFSTSVNLKDYVPELLKKYQRLGYQMFVVTGTNHKTAEMVLKRLGVSSFFEGIFDQNTFNSHKIELDFYSKVITQLNLDKFETIIFEDAIFAIKSGKASGAFTIGVYDHVSRHIVYELAEIADQFVMNFKEII